MRLVAIFAILIFPNFLCAQDWRIPAFYSIGLKKEHSLYSFAFTGPCGPTIELRSNQLPIKHIDNFMNEILELSQESKIINSWIVPIDSIPIGIIDDILISDISTPQNQYVYISKDGRISPVFDSDELEVDNMNCPEIKEKSQFNQYFVCSGLDDKKTGAQKFLAWQPPCT